MTSTTIYSVLPLLVLSVLHATSAQQTVCRLQADVVFVVDSSGSINDRDPGNFRRMKTFMQNIVRKLNVGEQETRVALVQFSNKGTVEFKLNEHYSQRDIISAIDRVQYQQGNTNTSGGLWQMNTVVFNRRNGDRDGVDNIAIMITDGMSTRDPKLTVPYANLAKSRGVKILAVGITDQVNITELRRIASPGSDNRPAVYNVTDFNKLSAIFESLITETCYAQTTVTPPPSTTAFQGCRLQADVAFVVDASGSINKRNPGNWRLIKNFIKAIVSKLNIGEYETRVGIVKFANRGYLEFKLNEYYSRSDMNGAIDRMYYNDGNTNTSGGLWIMNDVIFKEENGERKEANDICIVITDGVSTRDTRLVKPYADFAKRRGVRMFAIGITDQINMDELKLIASPSSADAKTIYNVTDFDKLTSIIQSLTDETCYSTISTRSTPSTTTRSTTSSTTTQSTTTQSTTTQSTTTERPRTTRTTRRTTERTTMTTRRPTTTTRTTMRTTTLPRSLTCHEQVDVVVALDKSGSVQSSNFDKMKRFTKDLITSLDIESGTARLGFASFATGATTHFDLNRHQQRAEMLRAVDGARFTGGSTNTAEMLRMVRENMYRQSAGDRNNARNVMLLITDGSSNDREATLSQARRAKAAGIHLLVVIVGNWYNEQEINAIASYPYEQNRFHIDRFDDLNDNFRSTLMNLMCNNDNECRTNPCSRGRCEDYIGGYRCICDDGYSGERCEQRCDGRMDIVFAMDASGSVGQKNFEKSANFVRGVIERLNIGSGSRAGLLTFANGAQPVFQLNAYSTKYDTLAAFPPHYTAGATNTAAALRHMRENMFTRNNGDQDGVNNVAVVLTDGKSQDEAETFQQAAEARKAGIHLIVVGVGNAVRMRELRAIASYPNEVGKNILASPNFDELSTLSSRLSTAICNNNNECSNRPCRNGGSCVDTINGYECICPRDYTGEHCDKHCDGRADIVFAIDTSGSIRRERFPVVLSFVQSVMKNLEIRQDRTRVGVLSWSDDAVEQFHLNSYDAKQDAIQAVEYVHFAGGRTHTASALRLLRTSMFSRGNGAREDAHRYAFLITDGNSNVKRDETITEAIKARIEGIELFVVSVGTQIDRFELRGIASEMADDHLFNVSRFSQLSSLITRISDSACNDIDECRSNPCQAGGRCVDGIKKYTCECPEGRTGYNCEFRCRRSMDVVIVLDLSGSTEQHHERAIEFARRLSTSLDMSYDRTRVGLISYGDSARSHFYLNTYRSKQEVVTAIAIRPDGGRTNTQAAIRLMSSSMFSSNRGDRPGVPNVAVIVTDGYSNVDRANTVPAAEAAKRQQIANYVVALGEQVDMVELRAIAGQSGSPPDDYVFALKREADLQSLVDRLRDRLCQ